MLVATRLRREGCMAPDHETAAKLRGTASQLRIKVPVVGGENLPFIRHSPHKAQKIVDDVIPLRQGCGY